MKRNVINHLLFALGIGLAFGISACCLFEPIPTPDQWLYISPQDLERNALTELKFPAEGGKETIYIETTVPYWMAIPDSWFGTPFVHPVVSNVVYASKQAGNEGWMSVMFRHAPLRLFNGYIEVTVTKNETGVARTEEIYIWNDDIPASITASAIVKITQADM